MSKKREIPTIMATQHPDNASKTYWTNSPFVSTQEEIEECYRCFSELGIAEYMWDWEGKFVDEAVIDRLFMTYTEYFKENPLGLEKFLTFRVPNIWVESTHKLPRAFMNMVAAENAAKSYGFHAPPLFEAILPMTSSADQLTYLQETFHKISGSTQDIFDFKSNLQHVELIPLFEEFKTIADSKNILCKYVEFLEREFQYKPEYVRVMTARSDPALNAGFLAAKLASKIAVSLYYDFQDESGVKVFPIVGGGCLPFRGGINPENIEPAIEEYAGYATLTIQSAFRYDYSLEQVRSAIAVIDEKLPQNLDKAERLSEAEVVELNRVIVEISKLYKPVVEEIADLINIVSAKLPSHRERVQHIGLFGYSRGEGKVKLPRAIKFGGALYSLGCPPEFIGAGRALKLLKEEGLMPLIERLCPYLKEDFKHAGHYINYENLELLAGENPAFKTIREDIELVAEILEIEIGPEKAHHFIHRNLTSNILYKLRLEKDFSEDVLEAAIIRKSLG